MPEIPVLETPRLLVRPFSSGDLEAIHQILDLDLAGMDLPPDEIDSLEERREWLEWTVLSYRQLAHLDQPPYGDRAVIEKGTGQLIGAVGYAPCLMPFEQLPEFSATCKGPETCAFTAEVGLYWAIATPFQRRGYASEAAQALVEYGFNHLKLKRIVATTSASNLASIGVMRKLGMRIEHNPFPDPSWFQVVGVLPA